MMSPELTWGLIVLLLVGILIGETYLHDVRTGKRTADRYTRLTYLILVALWPIMLVVVLLNRLLQRS